MKTVVTFGTYDLFHVGHVRILKRASELYDNCRLIVGVSSDKLNFDKKGFYPVCLYEERNEIVSSIKYVHSTFPEESMDSKVDYLKKYKADALVMGDDWEGKFDYCKDEIDGLEVVYFPRTEKISTTEIKKRVKGP